MEKNKILYSLFIYLFGSIFLQLILNKLIDPQEAFGYSLGMILNVLIITAFIYFLNRIEINKMFKDFIKNYKRYLLIIIIMWIIGFVLSLLTNYLLNSIFADTYTVSSNELMVRDYLNNYLIYSLIANIVLAPILEEFIFRLSFNEIKNKYLYLIITSLVFAFFHVVADINTLLDVIYLLPYMFLGLTLGFTYYKTKNIFSSIITHSLHNFLTIMLLLILGG